MDKENIYFSKYGQAYTLDRDNEILESCDYIDIDGTQEIVENTVGRVVELQSSCNIKIEDFFNVKLSDFGVKVCYEPNLKVVL